MIDKEDIEKLVSIFYQQKFKVFYINSEDGETLVRPFGAFVSLGITTSLKTLQNVCDAIEGSGKYHARLAEIRSISVSGLHLNHLTENKVERYDSELPKGVLSKAESEEKLKEYAAEFAAGNTSHAVEFAKFKELYDKIDDWDLFSILITEDGPMLFHKKINYKKVGNEEYRLGIFVS